MMIAILIAVFAGAIAFDYRLFRREIAPGEKILYLPYKYLRYVLIFVRGLSRNDDEPQNVQEGGDNSAER